MNLPYDVPSAPPAPTNGPQPGAIALRNYVLAYFDLQDHERDLKDWGIYNPRDTRGVAYPNWDARKLSAHAEGRACDFGVLAGSKDEGDRLANWLVANAEAAGVQEVIWWGKRWASNTGAWNRYSGRSAHADHVHVSLTRHAAVTLTVETLIALDSPVSPNPMEDEMGVIAYGVQDGVTLPTAWITDWASYCRPMQVEFDVKQLKANGMKVWTVDQSVIDRTLEHIG